MLIDHDSTPPRSPSNPIVGGRSARAGARGLRRFGFVAVPAVHLLHDSAPAESFHDDQQHNVVEYHHESPHHQYHRTATVDHNQQRTEPEQLRSPRRRGLRRGPRRRPRSRPAHRLRNHRLPHRGVQSDLGGGDVATEARNRRGTAHGCVATHRFDLDGRRLRPRGSFLRRAGPGARRVAPRLLSPPRVRVGVYPGMTSSTVAEPIPPPAHILETPMPPPRRANSLINVTIMRAPVAATG